MDNQNQENQPNIVPQHAPEPPITVVAAQQPLTKTEKFKHTYYQVLIGCLLGAAALAVVAVLAGGFTHTLGRALATIAMVALHAALSFSYITTAEKQDKKDGGRSIELFSNIVFALIVISFITSIFAIWQILGGLVTFKLYVSYGILLFATLHADVLYRVRRFEKTIDSIVNANYALMGIVVAMLFVATFSSSLSDLPSFFYRLLAATAIVDATMTITVVIMHKMYLQKHPVLTVSQNAQLTTEKSKNFWRNPIVIVLMFLLAAQVIGSLIALMLKGL